MTAYGAESPNNFELLRIRCEKSNCELACDKSMIRKNIWMVSNYVRWRVDWQSNYKNNGMSTSVSQTDNVLH